MISRILTAFLFFFGPQVFAYKASAYGFSKAQEAKIEKAVSVFNKRFLQNKIKECAYEYATDSMLRPEYLLALDNTDYWSETKNQSNLLNSQLTALNNQFDKKGADAFPDMNLYAYYQDKDHEDGAPIAHANRTDKMVVENDSVTGAFEIHINTYWLDKETSPYNDNEYWGAVLAHEGLHNMGHLHPAGDYNDRLQIIAFERCLRTNGEKIAKEWNFVSTCSSKKKKENKKD